jgi:uncharacterized protein
MSQCFFISDLHGKIDRYEKLFDSILTEKPDVVFFGGDLLPHSFAQNNFISDYLVPCLTHMKEELVDKYPIIFLILGNDDAKSEEYNIMVGQQKNIWRYIHFRQEDFYKYKIFGYSYTPPSPFLLKDWEKYDISRFTDHGSISPEEGKRTVEIPAIEKKYSTIKSDLESLTKNQIHSNSIFLFHGPPYQTNLDCVAPNGKMIDHTPLDGNVGSIAIKKFIEESQPLLTLHGHIHESARITGSWKDKIGKTFCFSAAHDGKELAIVKFDTENLNTAERVLV